MLGSSTTLLPGDLVYEEYNAGYLNVWCKAGGAQATWASLHTYAAGAFIEDSNGNIQYTAAGGVSGATVPGTWGSTGWTHTAAGATTSDGTVSWMYYGAYCPTGTKYTRVIHVADADLASGGGFPALWEGAQSGSSVATPLVNSISFGTVGTSGNPCATAGQCPVPGGLVSSGIF